ncbi:MAG: 16S rRNA (uracil(1498)-N(3))-methyltransferase [Candidatus Eremiobacteraeota bacterium]|nr:16S rRNA (uracil(1498)-N(3))-methyltransferase [Candidatus Eremiobacteraeota bacterium]
MKRPRLFLDPTSFGDEITLEADGSHYLTRVLRLKPGDRFVALDGQGREVEAELLDRHRARPLTQTRPATEARLELDLYLALAKGERFDRAIEKAAELGVARLFPLASERTEVRDPGQAKQERWQRLALSACALAGRVKPMRVEPVVALPQALCGPGWLLTEGAPPPSPVESERLSLYIGPEGGFTPAEQEMASGQGLTLVGLGPRNLRVETAAAVAVGLALFLAQDLQPRPQSL